MKGSANSPSVFPILLFPPPSDTSYSNKRSRVGVVTADSEVRRLVVTALLGIPILLLCVDCGALCGMADGRDYTMDTRRP